MKFTRQYIIDDFQERIEDFVGYFNSMITPREKTMIRDRKSFSFVADSVFSRDDSLRFWIANVGDDVKNMLFDSAFVQNTVAGNRSRRIISVPTIGERRETRRILQKTKKGIIAPTLLPKRSIKAFIRGVPIRAVPIVVKVMGRPQKRLRDPATGRFASTKKVVLIKKQIKNN